MEPFLLLHPDTGRADFGSMESPTPEELTTDFWRLYSPTMITALRTCKFGTKSTTIFSSLKEKEDQMSTPWDSIALDSPYLPTSTKLHVTIITLSCWHNGCLPSPSIWHTTAHNSDPKTARFPARMYLHWWAQISCQKLHVLLAHPSVV